MYNALSFALGLLALGLGIAAICKNGCLWYVLFSLTACSVSLAGQLLEVQRRVALSDWTALMDTIDAVVHDAVLLLAITTALNLAAVLGGHLHGKTNA